MVIGRPPALRPDDLPFQVTGPAARPGTGTLASVEREHVIRVLEENHWNISRSAEILDIDRATLYHKIEKYGLRKPV
jgi:transcriptional regulator of acetoin/glycerol metabolism